MALVEVVGPREDCHDTTMLSLYATDFHQFAKRHVDQETVRIRVKPIVVVEREMFLGVGYRFRKDINVS
eukprot:5234998-Heterocapsa_arctica.AAC.1